MTAVIVDPLRSAALTLHALPEEDRHWMLQALSRDDAERLAPLLQELQSLGIPRDASLLPRLDHEVASRPAWPEALDARRVDALLHVLAREPQGVARKLLSLRAWEWAPTLLAGMGDGETARPAVRPHGARFETELLNALGKHVEAQPEHAPTRATNSVWQRARVLLGRKGTAR